MAMLRHWDELAVEGKAPSAIKRRLPGTGAELVQIEVPAGTKAARHSHSHEQVVQVIAGSGTLETAEGRERFTAGSLFHFPADAWHAAEFDEDTVLVETNLSA